jgi:hypothetical protein
MGVKHGAASSLSLFARACPDKGGRQERQIAPPPNGQFTRNGRLERSPLFFILQLGYKKNKVNRPNESAIVARCVSGMHWELQPQEAYSGTWHCSAVPLLYSFHESTALVTVDFCNGLFNNR